MKYITSKFLKERDACPRALRKFKRTFPSGRVAITHANAAKHGAKFDACWLAEELLDIKGPDSPHDRWYAAIDERDDQTMETSDMMQKVQVDPKLIAKVRTDMWRKEGINAMVQFVRFYMEQEREK